nr:immunoglobulin light chain junction region [Macaca mulatta]
VYYCCSYGSGGTFG